MAVWVRSRTLDYPALSSSLPLTTIPETNSHSHKAAPLTIKNDKENKGCKPVLRQLHITKGMELSVSTFWRHGPDLL